MAKTIERQQPAQASTEVATQKPKQGVPAIKAKLEAASAQIAAVLPKHLTPEKVIQVTSTLCFRTPKLAQCDPNTILVSVIRASSLGLDLEPSMNEAFLIPRWNGTAKCNECQLQLGYQGLRKLAMQSDQIAYIRTEVVYEGDHFDHYFSPEPVFIHKPAPASNRGAIVSAYSHAKLKNGENLIEVMSSDQINAIMARSQSAGNGGPWATDWPEMARKTVLRRHCKSLPRSIDLDRALRYDEEMYEQGMIQASDARGMLGRPKMRGLAALAPANRGAVAVEEMPEPEFTPGVAQPLYTEADDPIDPASLPMEDDDPE